MSGIATGTALAIGLGTSAAAGIGTSIIGSNAAGNAANSQANSADYAANLQYQQAQQALQFQEQQYQQGQANLAPWLTAGEGGLANLSYLLGIGPQGSSGQASSSSANPLAGTPGTPGATGAPNAVNGQNPQAIQRGQAAPGSTLEFGQQGAPQANGAPPPLTTGNTGGVNQLPSLGSLVNPSLGGYGSLSQGWNQTFQAPTAAQAAATPGYQFAQDQGQQAIQRSAAANGNLLTGGTEKALDQYSQGLADTNYQQVYNNALGQYQMGYNQFENNQTNLYNRLASLAGLGQTTASQLNQQGQSAANGVSNILLGSGQQIGQNINNAGAARASGYVGQANAISGGLSSLGNSASLLALLGQGGSSGLGGNLNASNGYFLNQTQD